MEVRFLFLGFLCNCFNCFITVRITFTCILYLQYIYDLYHIHGLILSYTAGINWIHPWPAFHAEAMGSNPIEASEYFLGFLFNCFSCFITVRITFTSILYPQYDMFHVHVHISPREVVCLLVSCCCCCCFFAWTLGSGDCTRTLHVSIWNMIFIIAMHTIVLIFMKVFH